MEDLIYWMKWGAAFVGACWLVSEVASKWVSIGMDGLLAYKGVERRHHPR